MKFLEKISSETAPLHEWVWLVPQGYVPVYATLFGDVFLTNETGNFFFLNTIDGRLVDTENDDAGLNNNLKNDAELSEEILMPKLVKKLKALGISIKPGQCYSIKMPTTLGGQIAESNFEVLSLEKHLNALGKIQKQIANDPIGTKYKDVAKEF